MPSTWMWYVVPACARNVASLTTNGLRQVISARLPKPPLYTPTTVENWAATLAVTTALTAGVKLYQTVRCDEEPPEQDDGGSPASMLAAEMSTTSLNGRAEMTVALAKASFDRETSWVQTGTASNTPSLNVSWVTPLPSAFMTKMSSSPPSRVLWNAMRSPSGDQTGSSSTKAPEVSWVTPLPSAFMTKT